MRRVAIPAPVGLVGLVALAACTPDQGDFKSEAEKFINDDEQIEAAVGSDVSAAECQQPADTDEGTTYTCTAKNVSGDAFEFTVEITGDKELTVQNVEPAAS